MRKIMPNIGLYVERCERSCLPFEILTKHVKKNKVPDLQKAQ